jgi:hypothetical protein
MHSQWGAVHILVLNTGQDRSQGGCKTPGMTSMLKFWVVLVSAWLWGESWRGKLVYVFCDNEAVVETLEKQKPKDPKLQELLREYLYIVCTRGFTPKFRKIGTKANEVADFISRRHDPAAIEQFFETKGLPQMSCVAVPDSIFKLESNW